MNKLLYFGTARFQLSLGKFPNSLPVRLVSFMFDSLNPKPTHSTNSEKKQQKSNETKQTKCIFQRLRERLPQSCSAVTA